MSTSDQRTSQLKLDVKRVVATLNPTLPPVFVDHLASSFASVMAQSQVQQAQKGKKSKPPPPRYTLRSVNSEEWNLQSPQYGRFGRTAPNVQAPSPEALKFEMS